MAAADFVVICGFCEHWICEEEEQSSSIDDLAVCYTCAVLYWREEALISIFRTNMRWQQKK